jgi:single-stranded-DNA-specific exonuclease
MDGLTPRYAWRLRPSVPLTEELLDAGRARGMSERLIGLLARRGHADPRALAALLDEPRHGLHDPALLPDAAALVARVERAVARGEKALVFGDFDADGLTGLAIMAICLRRRGLDVATYVPDRGDEGHGLSVGAIERAATEGRTLIVTVDCGTSSGPEIELAAARGIDVLVTDHHRPPPMLPPAAAVVNAMRADSAYPDRRLCGAGIALKVAQLLIGDEALALADLAAIGTVADVAPLAGENRAIVRLGLALLRESPRPGLAALMESAGIDRARLDPERLAFGVVPRLNAVGRVGDAAIAARLLLTEDAAEAAALAAELEAANGLRRELMASALVEARAAVAELPPAPLTIVGGPWPVGIIGLLAGRLADELGRPAVVFNNSADPWRGSARAGGNFDLAGALATMAELFVRYGGHSAAAGCNLPAANFAAFRERLVALAAGLAPLVPSLELDLVADGADTDYRLLREVSHLEPVGSGNPEPLVGIRGLVVGRVRPANGGHTQLLLRKGREVLDGICFGRDDLVGHVAEGEQLDIVARLVSRTFGGFESLQLDVRDVGPAGTLDALLAGAMDAAPVAAPQAA